MKAKVKPVFLSSVRILLDEIWIQEYEEEFRVGQTWEEIDTPVCPVVLNDGEKDKSFDLFQVGYPTFWVSETLRGKITRLEIFNTKSRTRREVAKLGFSECLTRLPDEIPVATVENATLYLDESARSKRREEGAVVACPVFFGDELI